MSQVWLFASPLELMLRMLKMALTGNTYRQNEVRNKIIQFPLSPLKSISISYDWFWVRRLFASPLPEVGVGLLV